MSRVLLADIERLTFHKGEKTKGRRLPPIPQLKCVGSACKLYEPEVVRCHNIGGHGTDVDWTCEADLPEKLRFGRVDVSCEGWSEAGDPYVTKGSCGLIYRLVRLPEPGQARSYGSHKDTIATIFFSTLALSILALVLYLIFRDCRRQNLRRIFSGGNNPGPGGHRGGGRPSRGGPDAPPPPPYSPFDDRNEKRHTFTQQQPRQTSSSNSGDSSSFMRGAAVGAAGGAAALAAAQAIHRGLYNPEYRSQYDWERREQSQPQPQPQPPRTSWRNRGYDTSDRGEGSSSSNLGEFRASTGFATSTVR